MTNLLRRLLAVFETCAEPMPDDIKKKHGLANTVFSCSCRRWRYHSLVRTSWHAYGTYAWRETPKRITDRYPPQETQASDDE